MSFKFSLSWCTFLFCALVSLLFILAPKLFHRSPDILNNDIHYYYGYLPATIIEHDPTLQFVDLPNTHYSTHYWFLNSPNGGHVFKMSMGMSFLYFPFFILGHSGAKLFAYPADGFSEPYLFFLSLSGFVYMLLGIYFLRKILLAYFNEQVSSATLLILALGTNLFYYSVHEAAMTHAANFFLFSLILYLSIQWHREARWTTSIFLGIALGLATLIRPTNGIICLVPFFISIYNKQSFINKLQLLSINKLKIVGMMLCFFLVWIPQLIYWKSITGNWFYYSYGTEERFYFNHPHVLASLFSFRKGLFIYTPILLFSVIGLFLVRKRIPEFSWAIWVFTLLNIYIVSSWWCWWYGGSFGLRAYIEMYAIWAVPLAVFIERILAVKRFIRMVFITIATSFILLNIFQSIQYWRGALHWDGMNYTLYKTQFLNMGGAPESLVTPPDYVKARKGEEEYSWFSEVGISDKK